LQFGLVTTRSPMKNLWSGSLVLGILLASGQASSASPLGLWQAKDGGIIKIAECGQGLCGFIEHIAPGQATTDINNVDVSKRDRSLTGVPVLISMKLDAASRWSGQLYNPRDGRTYSGKLIEMGPSTIRIEGCWLMFCDGEDLNRLK
jgi:uncharacterized protein (DUF2147 family)